MGIRDGADEFRLANEPPVNSSRAIRFESLAHKYSLASTGLRD
jgi:hypothetical protein